MTELAKVNGFREWMDGRIKGQPEVLERLEAHVARSELGLTDPRYVRGAFLFVGPTGVGKTETTLCFAEYLFGTEACARFNMAEFKEAASVGELRVRLAQAKAQGRRVYLIDEIEKAHWEVLDLMLQLFDKGAAMTAPDGQVVEFTDSYFMMTSNLGAREAMRSQTKNYTSYSNTIGEYVRRSLRPELLGRVHDVGRVLVFRRLEEPEQREIARAHVAAIQRRLAERRGAHFTVTAEAFEYVMRQGFSEHYGARHLRGFVSEVLEGAVAESLRAGGNGCGEVRLNEASNGVVLRAAVVSAA